MPDTTSGRVVKFKQRCARAGTQRHRGAMQSEWCSRQQGSTVGSAEVEGGSGTTKDTGLWASDSIHGL